MRLRHTSIRIQCLRFLDQVERHWLWLTIARAWPLLKPLSVLILASLTTWYLGKSNWADIVIEAVRRSQQIGSGKPYGEVLRGLVLTAALSLPVSLLTYLSKRWWVSFRYPTNQDELISGLSRIKSKEIRSLVRHRLAKEQEALLGDIQQAMTGGATLTRTKIDEIADFLVTETTYKTAIMTTLFTPRELSAKTFASALFQRTNRMLNTMKVSYTRVLVCAPAEISNDDPVVREAVAEVAGFHIAPARVIHVSTDDFRRQAPVHLDACDQNALDAMLLGSELVIALDTDRESLKPVVTTSQKDGREMLKIRLIVDPSRIGKYQALFDALLSEGQALDTTLRVTDVQTRSDPNRTTGPLGQKRGRRKGRRRR